MNNQDVPQPVLQQRSRRVAGKVMAITLAIALPVILCGILCVGTPAWLLYQWNRGTYYGYVTIDDPTMTYTKNMGEAITYGIWQLQVQSMHFLKDDKGTTFLVVHVRINKNTSDPTSSSDNLPGRFVVYTSPVFDASGEHHAFTGNEIDPVGNKEAVPSRYASSRLNIDDTLGIIMNSNSLEGDVLFKVPSQNSPFVLVLLPQSSIGQYAWNSKIDDCKFLPVFHC